MLEKCTSHSGDGIMPISYLALLIDINYNVKSLSSIKHLTGYNWESNYRNVFSFTCTIKYE